MSISTVSGTSLLTAILPSILHNLQPLTSNHGSILVTPKEKRRHVWRHNSYLGHVIMMRANLNQMIASPSTSTETKQLARSMLGLLPKLQNSLQFRIDPDG